MLKYTGDFDKLKKYGFERKLYQGAYFMIKRLHIDYETQFQNTTDFNIFVGLNNRVIDAGWAKKREVNFKKGLIGFVQSDLNLYDGYSFGKLCENENDLLIRIDNMIDLLDDKDSEIAGKLYELNCIIKQLIKDGLVEKVNE